MRPAQQRTANLPPRGVRWRATSGRARECVHLPGAAIRVLDGRRASRNTCYRSATPRTGSKAVRHSLHTHAAPSLRTSLPLEAAAMTATAAPFALESKLQDPRDLALKVAGDDELSRTSSGRSVDSHHPFPRNGSRWKGGYGGAVSMRDTAIQRSAGGSALHSPHTAHGTDASPPRALLLPPLRAPAATYHNVTGEARPRMHVQRVEQQRTRVRRC